jgi:hypothetical protein
MGQIKQAALDYEFKRWMCPDWRRYWKPGCEDDALYRHYFELDRKYDPNQPRVAAGSPQGGQWTSEGGAEVTAPSEVTLPRNSGRPATQIAARISSQRRAECEEQLRKDTFICNTVRTRSCWAQANFRYSLCLIGGYVPPIFH